MIRRVRTLRRRWVVTATLAYYRVQVTSDLAGADLYAAGAQLVGGAAP
jgi:hypothetical protein